MKHRSKEDTLSKKVRIRGKAMMNLWQLPEFRADINKGFGKEAARELIGDLGL